MPVQFAADDEVAQRELADDLRAAVLDGLASQEGVSIQPRRMAGARRTEAEPT